MRPKHGARHTNYTPRTIERVGEILEKYTGPEHAATWDRIARANGIAQRQLRAVATGRDGLDWLLGYVDPEDVGEGEAYGIFVCRSAAEARSLTYQLVSKATDELARAGRRDDYAARMALPVAQLELFGHKGEAA